MSMTIGTTLGVNELQLHAMLTGQLKEATRLEGWEAFKNFFIKLLNHLPGMNLEDKEKKLRDIYNTIYGEKTAAASAGTHSIETLWPAVERLIHLMEGDQVRAMEFEVISHDVSRMTGEIHTQGDLDLVIRVDDHMLPAIALSNSDMHREMLSSVLFHHMTCNNRVPGVYQLDPETLVSQGSRVEFTASAVMATSHGFKVARALEASRELVKTPVREISNLDDQIAQLAHYQQRKADLTQLRSVRDVHAELHSKCIDDALEELDTHRQQQLASIQQLNQKFVKAFVEECANNLVQEGLLSKAAINTKMSHLSALTPHRDALFQQVDSERLQSIQAQLELASQVADLQEQLQSSVSFPQEPFSNLQVAMRQAKAGPLTELLDTLFNVIKSVSPYNIAKKEIEVQAQQASGKLLKSLEAAEAKMAILLSHPDIPSDMDFNTFKKMVTQIPPFTPDKNALSSRAETLHKQNIAITRIDSLLSEGLTLAKEDVLNYPREDVIDELQKLNAKLPESQRKSWYQLRIDNLNEGLLHRKVDVWKEHIGSMPDAGRSAALENAVQALTALKAEGQQIKISEKKKAFHGLITTLIAQHEDMGSFEATLRSYKESNKYATKEVVSDLSTKIRRMDDSPRKLALMEHVTALQTKNNEMDAVNKLFAGVNQKIIEVSRFQTTWSEDLSINFNSVKTRALALPDGKQKESLLRNIANTENTLQKVQNQEMPFSKLGKWLAKAAETNGTPSSHWPTTFPLLKGAGAELKKLPESPRTKDFATRLGNDTSKALNLLKGMIAADPKGDINYMAEREEEYKSLRDFINSMADYLPNGDGLTKAVKDIKHKNNFRSRTFLEKFA